MLSNINNSQLVNKKYVLQLKKKNCEQILNVLWDEGFILGYKVLKSNTNKLKIFLKYNKGNSAINSIKLISKPSLKVYYSLKKLWKLESNQGVTIISTNKGFMSDVECKKIKKGGEAFILIK